MPHLKNITAGFIVLSTAAISAFAFPATQSNAAPSVSGTMSLVNQMYTQIAGKQAPTTTKPSKPSTTTPPASDSGNTDTGNSKDDSGNTNTGNTGGNNGDSSTKPDTGNTPTTPPVEEDQSSVALADKIIATGEKFLGTPYQYGAASGQTRTFDCLSFTQYVFKQHGISLLRSSRQQYTQVTSVARDQLKKGDLLFFSTSSSGGKIAHVGIYAGNNQILHTWGSKGVQYESLDRAWLKQGYIGAKRVIK